MSDGTVPVNEEDAATSATPDNSASPFVAQIRATTRAMMRELNLYSMWTAWVVVGNKAFKYSSHLDRSEAYRVAESFGGVVTETPLVADYRPRPSND